MVKRQQFSDTEIRVAVVADHDRTIVRLMFSDSVNSLGLTAVDARSLAAMLIRKADDIDAALIAEKHSHDQQRPH
jgi:hypothetical protein